MILTFTFKVNKFWDFYFRESVLKGTTLNDLRRPQRLKIIREKIFSKEKIVCVTYIRKQKFESGVEVH